MPNQIERDQPNWSIGDVVLWKRDTCLRGLKTPLERVRIVAYRSGGLLRVKSSGGLYRTVKPNQLSRIA